MSRVEQPPYTVERTEGPIELRAYPAMVVAATTVSGDRSAAIQAGFRTLADYIFGANEGARKIAMTAPVLQGRAPTPAGGAEVTPDTDGKMGRDGKRTWTVRFVMPRGLVPERLPKPRDGRVTLATMPPATYAAIRFSGFWRDALMQTKTGELEAFLARHKLAAKSAPIYAFYNPPWTLPFFRRNEVMIEIKR